jgi:hypothetical protein
MDTDTHDMGSDTLDPGLDTHDMGADTHDVGFEALGLGSDMHHAGLRERKLTNLYAFQIEIADQEGHVVIEDYTPVSIHANDKRVHDFHIMFPDGANPGFLLAKAISCHPRAFYDHLHGTPTKSVIDGALKPNVPNPMGLPASAGFNDIVWDTVKENLENDMELIEYFRNHQGDFGGSTGLPPGVIAMASPATGGTGTPPPQINVCGSGAVSSIAPGFGFIPHL